jgi:hypothetical protein
MAAQKDFCEASGQEVIFYPKFHYELNLLRISGVLVNGIYENFIYLFNLV